MKRLESSPPTSLGFESSPAVPLNEFSTADIGQAAYLMALGHKFLGAEHTGRDRVIFKFADGEDSLASDRALEYANNCMAPAKGLLEAMRFLKSILRDVRPEFKQQSGGINMNVQGKSKK